MITRTKETDARILIDDQLRQAGWEPADKTQVLTEQSVPEGGRADYVLLDQNGRPLAVVEAKRSAIQPYVAKQQALPYAKQLNAPFIFLTNGELIYFWDYTNDDARIVNAFYSRRDLERVVHMRGERKPLATIPIPDYYLRQGEQRKVRPYQQDAMKALDHAIELGKRRFLIELPTGTGKTDLICLHLKRLIHAGRAERILFLVDREQLAKQALEAIQDILDQYGSYWLRPGMVRQEKQITVCLLQTMIGHYPEFSSGYFDVVVADECHRSIYGSWQTALTHFDALHIGLTATPSAYIERNTFEFYQCNEGTPDIAYPFAQAFDEGYLIPYHFATGITEIIAEGADQDEEHYDPFEFERNWTNEKTNRLMMEEFDRLAWETYEDMAPNQNLGPGKGIIFAITKHHAARLAQHLNDLHPEHQGRYAEVITSDVANAGELIRKFKQEDYPQIAVSVGMLDTGFDCREILHLVMCRRVRSPILYQQMRGRGTRTAPHIGKKRFVIYDFFHNHQYFNDSDTDVFTSHGGGHAPSATLTPPRPPGDLVELGLEDEWLEAVTYVEIGPEGERVDKREYVTQWEQTINDQAAAMAGKRVGMLDTGFDCREILHLVMCRRVRSPILYQQMRGRGTRTAPHIGKKRFVIYDFFHNHQYFNDSDTDVFTSHGGGHAPSATLTPPRPPGDLVELGLEDEWLEAVTYVEIGPEGERVDKREYVTQWEQTINDQAAADPLIRKVRDGEPLTETEESQLSRRLNEPELYFNEDNLRRAYRDPGGTLVDFIRAALGMLKIKSREERMEENFRAWLVSKSLTPEQAQYLSLLKNRGIAKGRIEIEDLFAPPLSILNAGGLGIELFGEQGLKDMVADLNESVFQEKSA